MPWIELFATCMVAHCAGDFLLQTTFQALYKRNGLSGGVALKALASHIFFYTLCFTPIFIWIGCERSLGWALLAIPVIAIPHMIQDDGRLIAIWGKKVKKLGDPPSAADSEPNTVYLFVDQSFHVLVLFLTALWIGF